MSLHTGKTYPGEPPRLVIACWIGLGALLVAELLAFTMHFHTGALPADVAWWAQILRAMPYILRFGMAAGAATLLFGHAELWSELRHRAASPDRAYRRSAFLVGHVILLLLFLWLSAVVFAGDLALWSSFPPAWTAAWFIAGAASLAFWGLVCLSLVEWLGLLRRLWKPMILGSIVGPLAYTVSPVANLLWHPFGHATLTVVHGLLGLLFPGQVVGNLDEFEVGTEAFRVRIWPSCSGYAGLAMMTVFLAAYLWHFRKDLRFPAAFMLLPLGGGAIWLLNSARLVLLIAIGSWGWPDVALGGFHKNAGWAGFLLVALGLVVLAGRTPWLASAPGPRAVGRAPSPTAAYLGPFLAVLLATLLTGLVSSNFDWLYPVRVVAAAWVLWSCRGAYAELRGRWSWQGPAVGVGVFVLWLALTPAGTTPDSGWPPPLTEAPAGWAVVWLAFRLAGYVLTVPLAEELAFRGYLARRLTATDFTSLPPGGFSWFAFLLSSVLFGAMHGQWWLAGTLSGMLFAIALRRRGRLIDAVLAHATANTLIAGYVLATGRWSLWS
jgi:exosortase E/protease (VPEID-CTERM system)